MDSKSQVFSIVVTFNAMKWIDECLSSICNTTTVIVIDNNSSDETVEHINANYTDIIVLDQKENLGFGRANNIGISYALDKGCDYVLLFNQDAVMFGDGVSQLLRFALNHPEYGIISPIHCDWSGEFLESSFARYVSYENNENFYSDFVLNKLKKEVYNVHFLAAACWFMPKEVFNKVGGFDPIFFHIGEDSNLAQRILFHDFKIGVLPNCKIGHDTKNRFYPKVEKYSEKYFYKLNYHRKIKFADVHIKSAKAKANYLRNQLYKDAFFELLQCRFSNVKGINREIRDLRVILFESLKSAEFNRNQGKHYL